MSNQKVYKPYNSNIGLLISALIFIGFCVIGLAVFVFGLYLTFKGKVIPTTLAIIICGIGIVSMICGINLMISMLRIKICFEDEGVYVVNNGKGKSQFISWEKFLYAYFCRNSRNHKYLILTDKEISEKEKRKLTNTSFWKMLSKGVFSVLIDWLSVKDKVQIEKIVNEKVPNVSGFATLLVDEENYND